MEAPRKKTLYENIHALRQKPETCKVGLHYNSDSDMNIMKEAELGTPIEEIAKTQKRTPRAIKIRIINIALQVMKQRNLSLEDISRMYHINIKMLSRHYQRMIEREDQVLRLIKDSCK